MLRVPAGALRTLWTDRFPLGLHLIEGVSRSARELRVDGPAAGVARGPRHAGRRARPRAQQPGGRGHPGGRRPAGRTTRCCRRCAGSPRRRSPPTSSPGSTSCAGSSARRPAGTRWSSPTAEDALSGWLARHGVTRDWVMAPVLAAAGADVDWCDRVADVLGAAPARAGPGVGGEHPVAAGPAGRGQGVHPADLRPGRGGEVLLPARPRLHAARPTSPRGWRAPW